MLREKSFTNFMSLARKLVILASLLSMQLWGQANSTNDILQGEINNSQIIAIPAFAAILLAQGFQVVDMVRHKSGINVPLGGLIAQSIGSGLLVASFFLEKDQIFTLGQGLVLISVVPLFFFKFFFWKRGSRAVSPAVMPVAAPDFPPIFVDGIQVQTGLPIPRGEMHL